MTHDTESTMMRLQSKLTKDDKPSYDELIDTIIALMEGIQPTKNTPNTQYAPSFNVELENRRQIAWQKAKSIRERLGR